MTRRRAPSDFVLVLSAWMLVALLRGSPRLLLSWPVRFSPAEILLAPLLSALAWAALTPLVAAVCRRLPAGEVKAPVLVLAHALLAFPFLVIQGWLCQPILAAFQTLTLDPSVLAWETWFRIAVSLPRQLSHYAGAALVITYVQALRRSLRAARLEARLAAEVAEAELDALRARLSPAFFFRALDAIVARAATLPGDAEEMVVALGELLRRASDGKGTATLAAERAVLDAWARVESAEIGVTFAPETLALEVPSGLVPRLLEESREAVAGAPLEVRAERDGALLKLTIESAASAAEGAAADLARIARLYGDEASVVVATAPRFTVSVRLPARAARPEALPAPYGVRRSA